MNPWFLLCLALAALCSAAILTSWVRQYALRTRMMDIPNDRSSHSVATPRGGGLSLVLVFSVAVVGLALAEQLSLPLAMALGPGGVLVAAIGYLDDHRDVPARWRLLVHGLAAAWALWWLGGLPSLPLFGVAVEPSWLGLPLGLLFIVWLLNLYNFMDGIDGLAGAEAVSVALAAALLLWLGGAPAKAGLMVLLAAAALGFLLWNWPPARIFMGDVGSAYLGYVFAVFALGLAPGLLNLWAWLILLGVFIVDASLTLMRRMLRGDRVHHPHRSHAYQYATRRWNSHAAVTITVVAINLLWLLPLAWAAMHWPHWGATLTALAWLPLVVAAVWLGAGRPEDSGS